MCCVVSRELELERGRKGVVQNYKKCTVVQCTATMNTFIVAIKFKSREATRATLSLIMCLLATSAAEVLTKNANFSLLQLQYCFKVWMVSSAQCSSEFSPNVMFMINLSRS